MEYREFGRAKARVSTIGMGTYFDAFQIAASHIWGWSGREDKVAALKKGIELGINLIDTAEIYNTEPLVAEAISDHKREDLFIATKVWRSHLKYQDVLKAAQRSLEKLHCNYIDLYQIHWPNSKVPIKETMRAMEKLVDNGKVRHIGVSNFSLSQMRETEEALSKYELVSNQVEYNLIVKDITVGVYPLSKEADIDLLAYCERNGVVTLAYRPIAHGALASPSGRLKEVMDEISQKHGGKTPAMIGLNWLLRQGKLVFPIPRASRPARVVENTGAVGWSLDPDDLTLTFSPSASF